jgi:hypothetical protein
MRRRDIKVGMRVACKAARRWGYDDCEGVVREVGDQYAAVETNGFIMYHPLRQLSPAPNPGARVPKSGTIVRNKRTARGKG